MTNDTLCLIYSEAKDSLNRQITSIDGLDAKASTMIASVGILTTIVLSIQPIETPVNQILLLISVFP